MNRFHNRRQSSSTRTNLNRSHRRLPTSVNAQTLSSASTSASSASASSSSSSSPSLLLPAKIPKRKNETLILHGNGRNNNTLNNGMNFMNNQRRNIGFRNYSNRKFTTMNKKNNKNDIVSRLESQINQPPQDLNNQYSGIMLCHVHLTAQIVPKLVECLEQRQNYYHFSSNTNTNNNKGWKKIGFIECTGITGHQRVLSLIPMLHVEQLILSNPPEPCIQLVSILSSHKHHSLKELTLQKITFSVELIQVLMDGFANENFQQLELLDLSDSVFEQGQPNNVDNNNITAIQVFAKKLQQQQQQQKQEEHTLNLKRLCLESCQLRDEEIATLANVLPFSIKEFNIKLNFCQSAGYNALSANTNLEYLNVSQQEIWDDRIYLQPFLQPGNLLLSSSLISLDWSNNFLSDNHIVWLTDLLQSSTTTTTTLPLQHINLSHNSIGDDGITYFAKNCLANQITTNRHHHHSLQRINLNDNRFSIIGIKSLMNALKHNTSIMELRVSSSSTKQRQDAYDNEDNDVNEENNDNDSANLINSTTNNNDTKYFYEIMINYYVNMNRGGRKLLSSSSSNKEVPLSIWPLVLERANRISIDSCSHNSCCSKLMLKKRNTQSTTITTTAADIIYGLLLEGPVMLSQ